MLQRGAVENAPVSVADVMTDRLTAGKSARWSRRHCPQRQKRCEQFSEGALVHG